MNDFVKLKEDYKILEEIGKGGTARVYMALDTAENRTVAVKCAAKSETEGSRETVEILKNEADILRGLRNPGIPMLYDTYEDSGSVGLVMEYIEGRSLGQLLEEEGAQKVEDVAKWAIQLCDILNYLHTRPDPVVFRDVKPSNIMLRHDGGRIVLVDFGSAIRYTATGERTLSWGTPDYAAPEQRGSGGKWDARTDVYCVGTTIYHLVTGKKPNIGMSVPAPAGEINRNISKDFERIIAKCMAIRPEDRYQNMEELRAAIEKEQVQSGKINRRQLRFLSLFIGSWLLSLIFLAAGLLTQDNSQLTELVMLCFSGFFAFAGAVLYFAKNMLHVAGILSELRLQTSAAAERNRLKTIEAFTGRAASRLKEEIAANPEGKRYEKVIQEDISVSGKSI